MGNLSQALSQYIKSQTNEIGSLATDFYTLKNQTNKEKLSADYIDVCIMLDTTHADGLDIDTLAKENFDINAKDGWGNTLSKPFKTLSAAMDFVGPKVNHVAYHLRANNQTKEHSTHLPGSMPHFSNRSMHIYNDIPQKVYVMFDLDPAKVEAAADGTFASAYINKLYTGIYGGVYFHFEGCCDEPLVFCLSKPILNSETNKYEFTNNIYYGDGASQAYKDGLKNMYWQWHNGSAVFKNFWTVFRNEQLNNVQKENYKEYNFNADDAQSGSAWVDK